MHHGPVISILTPTRNRHTSFLPHAIASARSLQLTCPYEHIIVDDASDDGTYRYLEQMAQIDPRIVVVHHDQQRGVASARNSAAHAAQGTFLVDLDDDDMLTAAGVEQRWHFLCDNPAFWAVHANALKVDEEGRYLIGEDVTNWFCPDRTECARLFFTSAMIPNASTAMYRRRELLDLGAWDDSLTCCEDYDLWLRSIGRYGAPGFISDIVALYRAKRNSLGINSVRSGVHERNQNVVKNRHRHLVAPDEHHAHAE